MNNNINLILDGFSKNDIPSQSLYEKFIKNIDFSIDEDYLAFIAQCNGADGDIGNNEYLSLWDIENVLSCNPYYEDVQECLDLFFFGTDGSNYGYAFDKHTGGIVGIDFMDIGTLEPDKTGDSFAEFLNKLNN